MNKKSWVGIFAATVAGIGAIAAILGDLEKILGSGKSIVDSVSDPLGSAYYHRIDKTNEVANKLLANRHPNARICIINVEWLDLDRDKKFTDLFIEFWAISPEENCPNGISENKGVLGNSVAVFKSTNWTANMEFELMGLFKEEYEGFNFFFEAASPFLVRQQYGMNNIYVTIFAYWNGDLVEIDKFNARSETTENVLFRYSVNNDTMFMETANGPRMANFSNVEGKPEGAPLTPSDISKIDNSAIILSIDTNGHTSIDTNGYIPIDMDSHTSRIDILANGSPISLESEKNGNLKGSLSLSRLDKVYSMFLCEFDGFTPINDSLGSYHPTDSNATINCFFGECDDGGWEDCSKVSITIDYYD